jgi:nicotinamide-nucleotide amidase
MKAEIIASGTELLLGEIKDTNTAFIASRLATQGIDLHFASIVGDNYQRYLELLKQAWKRSDVVITTGGLGPTKGDITREVIAGLMNEEMQVDESLKQNLESYFIRQKSKMPEGNLKQATLIPSAVAVPNPRGTAPGWWVEKSGKVIIALPGPPGEMQPMWDSEIGPKLEKRSGAIILSRTLKSWGISEGKLDEMLTPFLSGSNPTTAIYAKIDGIHVRITAKAVERRTAGQMILKAENEILKVLGDSVWGKDEETLESLVGKMLTERGLTLAVAESFSGGLLASALANVSGSRSFFNGGLVATSEPAREILGDHHASSETSLETTRALAAGVRTRFNASIGVALDGSRDLETGQTGKAFFAIDTGIPGKNIDQVYQWRPQQLVSRSIMYVLFNLRKALLTM